MANTYTWNVTAPIAVPATDAAAWTPSGPPGRGATAILTNGGTILFTDLTLEGNTLKLGSGTLDFSGDSTINSSNPTFDSATTLTTDTGLAAAQSTLNANGNFLSFGSIVVDGAAGSSLIINLNNYVSNTATTSGQFTNDGEILVDSGNTLRIAGANGAQFTDWGTVEVNGGTALINAVPSDAGFAPGGTNATSDNMVITGGGSLEIAQSSTSVYANIQFNGAGTLKIDQPGSVFSKGTADINISGFAAGDTLDLGTLAVTSVVFDGNGDMALLDNTTTVFYTNSNGGLIGDSNGGTFAMAGTGGFAGGLSLTEGGGGDTVITAAPASTYLWNSTNSSFTPIAGPAVGEGGTNPNQGDTAIVASGTVNGGNQFNLTSNRVELGGTAGAGLLVTGSTIDTGDGNVVSFAKPTLDDASIITNAMTTVGAAYLAPTAPETSFLGAAGTFINEGSIVAGGVAGSTFTIAVSSTSIVANGTTTALPGFFFNTNLLEATNGNTLDIKIGANAELFDTGYIIADGGDVVITAAASTIAANGAIAGGFAPVRGMAIIEGGGTLETNADYASTVSGTGGFYLFGDTTAGNTLKIDNPGTNIGNTATPDLIAFAGRIQGFQAGDTIDIGSSLPIGSIATVVFSQTTGILNLENNAGSIVASLDISGGAFGNGTFAVNNGTANGFTFGTLVANGTTDVVLTTTLAPSNATNISGAWQSAGSWQGGLIPSTGTAALIGEDATSAFTLTTGTTGVLAGGITIESPLATVQVTSDVTLQTLNNGTLTPNNINDISGTFDIASGNTVSAGALLLTEPSAAVTIAANATLDLAGKISPNLAPVGTIVNGTTTFPWTFPAGDPYSVSFNAGTLEVDGALLAGPASTGGGGGSVNIADEGNVSASMTVNSGGTVTDTFGILASDPTSAGTLTINGAGASWTDTIDPTDTAHSTGFMYVGYDPLAANTPTPTQLAAAQLTIENGATLTDQEGGIIAGTADSSGTVTVTDGGLWDIANNSTFINNGTTTTNIDAGYLNVGSLGTGLLTVSAGGTVEVGGNGTFFNNGTTFTGNGIVVGFSAGATGTLDVTGPGSEVLDQGGMQVGRFTQGLLDITNGGTVMLDGAGSGINVGASATSTASGTIEVGGTGSAAAALDFTAANGSTAAAGGLTIGNGAGAQGTLIVSDNGTINMNGTGYLTVGNNAGSMGDVVVGGTNASATINITTAGMTIGNLGTGNVTVNSLGTISMTGGGAIGMGEGPTAAGTLTISGGQVTTSQGAYMGGAQGASGSILVENNGSMSITGGWLNEGGIAGSNASVTVQGSGSSLQTSGTAGVTVGLSGNGTLTVNNGGSLGMSGTGGLILGQNSGASGQMTVSGGTVILSQSAAFTSIGGSSGSGTGTLTVSNSGLFRTAGGMSVGQSTGSGGSVAINGGGSLSFTGSNGLTLGSGIGSSGQMTLTGGVVNMGTNGAAVDIGNSGSGTLTINSGGSFTDAANLTVGQFSGASGSIAVNQGGTLQLNGTGGFNVGANSGSSGQITVAGGAVNITQSSDFVTIGNFGTGALTIGNGGTFTDASGLTFAQSSGSSASLTVSGSGSKLNMTGSNALILGNSGTANATISASATLALTGSGGMTLGNGFGAAGDMTINGGLVTFGASSGGLSLAQFNASASVGVTNAGTISLAGGGLFIGAGGTNVSVTVAGAGSVIDTTGTAGITVGQNGSGTLTVSGGATVSDANNLTVDQSGFNSSTLSVTGATVTAASLNDDGGGTITLSGGTIGVTGFATIGSGGFGSAASLSVSSGTFTASAGFSENGPAAVTISGGGIGTGGNATVGGSAGNASLTLTGGSLTAAGGLTIASAAGATGTVTVGNARISAGGLTVGGGGAGNLTIGSGGTVTNTGGTAVDVGGFQAGASGVLTINSGGLLQDTTESFVVGGSKAFGTVTVNAGGSLLTGNVGANAFSDITAPGGGMGAVTVTGAGAAWTSNNQIIVGDSAGAGALDINTSGVVNAGVNTVVIGQTVGANGTVSLESGGSLLAGNITMNNNGSATAALAISGGTVQTGSLTANYNAAITVGSGSLSATNGMAIGQTGAGASLTETGGQVTTDSVTVGQNTGATGTVTVSGGLLNDSGQLSIGGQGTGAVIVNTGGSLIAGGVQVDAGLGTPGTGSLIVNGGSATINGASSVGNGGTASLLVEAGGALTVNANQTAFGIGSSSGGTASVTVNAGLLAVVNASVQLDGGSLLVANAGTFESSYQGGGPAVDIDAGGGAQAMAEVTGANSLWELTGSATNDQFAVGDGGSGSLTINAGGVVNTGTATVDLGNSTGGAGTITISGGGTLEAAAQSVGGNAIDIASATGSTGTLTVTGAGSKVTATGQLDVGGGGSGGLTIANQATVLSGNSPLNTNQGLDVASNAAASGAITVTGTRSLLSNTGQFLIGDQGLGSLFISAGATVTTTAGATIANASGSSGSQVNITGPGSTLQVTGTLTVGNAGAGALTLDNGALTTAGALDAGAATTGDGSVSVTGAGTRLDVAGTITIGDAGSGLLSVLAGATVAAAGLSAGAQTNGSGQLAVSGTLLISGELDLGGADLGGYGELEIGPGGFVSAAAVAPGGGPVSVVLGTFDPAVDPIAAGTADPLQGGTIDVSGGFIMNEGTIVTDATKGGLAGQVHSVLRGTIVGGGTLTESGAFTYDGGPTGPGLLQIGAGSVLEIAGAVISGGTTAFADEGAPPTTYTVTDSVIEAQFLGASGILQLDDIGQFGGTVTSFSGGDEIVVRTGGTAGVDTLSGLVSNGNTLSFTDNGTVEAIVFGAAVGGAAIVNGDTIMACFAEGTRIGGVAVEDLRVGDRVPLAAGGSETIIWVGSRAVDCARHPRPETVWPVRVAAGAFGVGMPGRALFLSPDHAVFADGVLVPVRLLVNGGTIAQVRRRRVVYYHVELAEHAVILAEGMPCESYLDTGDRADFGSRTGVVRLFPAFGRGDTARLWETKGAAELVVAGERLERVRGNLTRAVAIARRA